MNRIQYAHTHTHLKGPLMIMFENHVAASDGHSSKLALLTHHSPLPLCALRARTN